MNKRRVMAAWRKKDTHIHTGNLLTANLISFYSKSMAAAFTPKLLYYTGNVGRCTYGV